jgi:hypothetical protein
MKIFALLLVLALCVPALAQEYGKPEELKGLTKMFVDTGGDMKNRERISKEIEEAKLGIQLLDSEEGAEIILDFGGGKDKRLGGSDGILRTKTYTTGTGRVFCHQRR